MFESHGVNLNGQSRDLKKCGKGGKLKQNIERDIHRRVGCKVSCLHLMLISIRYMQSNLISSISLCQLAQLKVPITYVPVPFKKTATDPTRVVRQGYVYQSLTQLGFLKGLKTPIHPTIFNGNFL